MLKRLFYFLTAAGFSFTGSAYAALSPEDVLRSARDHYPQIKAALAEQKAARASFQSRRGAFDATLEQNVSNRASGFYDGQQIDTRVVKPFPSMNAQIYGGYRVSDGTFPIYEDQFVTNQGGEALIGAELSLLRNRLIDKRRADLALAEIDIRTAEIDTAFTRMTIHNLALQSYWRWAAAGLRVKVSEALLALTENRQEALQKRFKRGDAAKILLTENRQNITSRQSALLKERQNFREAANRLSLFYRNPDGAPQIAAATHVPAEFPAIEPIADKRVLLDAIKTHPALRKLYQETLKERQALALGENALLPKIDLKVEASDDFGDGSFTRQARELKAELSISFPLQRNLGEGQVRQAEEKIRRLEHRAQLQEEQLRVEFGNALIALDAAAENINVTKQEITLAERMEKAERSRFAHGDSDFFLINMREQALANAKVKHILANLDYHTARAKLDMLTLNQEGLRP